MTDEARIAEWVASQPDAEGYMAGKPRRAHRIGRSPAAPWFFEGGAGGVSEPVAVCELDEHEKARFWSQVTRTAEGCWCWKGPTRDGYGLFHVRGQRLRAHRVAYELCEGAIPEGLTLDHRCRFRRCVNPAHLEPVTRAENAHRRGLAHPLVTSWTYFCDRGHDMSDPANVVFTPKAHEERCRICRDEARRLRALRARARREARKSQAASPKPDVPRPAPRTPRPPVRGMGTAHQAVGPILHLRL